MLQAIGHHVELQRTDRPEDEVVADERPENLGRTLLAQLVQPLLQGLHAQRVAQHHAPEEFRGEIRNTGEFEVFALGESIADLDRAMVVKTDDVAGVCGIHLLAFARHEGNGIGDLHVTIQPHLVHLHALGVFAGGDAEKSDAVAVLGVHVRLNLEDKSGEWRLIRIDDARRGFARARRRRVLDKVIEQLAHSEIVDG